MSPLLYLDTARLGQVSPSAKRAIAGALEFNQALGASAYFDELLCGGAGALQIANDFDGLEFWPGIQSLSSDIKETIFGSKRGELVFASKTSSLMSLAAKMLFARCSKILVTDLNWQPFNDILRASATSAECRISTVEIKRQIFDRIVSSDELIEKIVFSFVANQCDGIYLPAVCNWGVSLPIAEILQAIRKRAEIRFSLLDAAQAINHVDLKWVPGEVDFTFGGTHKWLRSYEPMAIGHFSKLGSRSFIRDTIRRELMSNPMADPLTRITQTNAPHKNETVNLCPLFAVAGAMADAKKKPISLGNFSDVRAVVEMTTEESNWKCVNPNLEFMSRILLLKNSRLSKAKAGIIRRQFIHAKIAVTGYSGGICRISLPDSIRESQTETLREALKEAA